MRKYYTRACNFYYGTKAQNFIEKKLALPLCGNKSLAFDHVEILSRKNKSKVIHIKKINLLNKVVKHIVQDDIKKIVTKRSNLNKNLKFSDPLIMGILNLTPDSFSDGGLFNQSYKAFSHI
jgi:dihydropteroate synthase